MIDTQHLYGGYTVDTRQEAVVVEGRKPGQELRIVTQIDRDSSTQQGK